MGSTNLGLGDCVAGRMVLFSELPVSAGVGVGVNASVDKWSGSAEAQTMAAEAIIENRIWDPKV